MSDPSAHPERTLAMHAHPAHGPFVTTTARQAEVFGGELPPPPFADRPCKLTVTEFTVANVPGVHPQDSQWEVTAQIARFDTKAEADDAKALIGRMLTGEDRTSV